MMAVVVNGRQIKPSPKRIIGKGGEADLFDIGAGLVLKLFKPPSHPDFANNRLEQQEAARRLDEHQTKLADFPKGLPRHVVTPETLAYDDKHHRVVGYVMPKIAKATVLMRFGERSYRQNGVGASSVCNIFSALHAMLSGLHQAQVIIGDFNDLNVLVVGSQPHLVDTDSFQFGPYLCRMFSEKFVDPLLYGGGPARGLAQAHNQKSDWYAYAVMLMRALLYVDPYGGVYKPHKGQPPCPPGTRPLHRITVFHPQVLYPKPALPLETLSDELLHYFVETFEHDKRNVFDLNLLTGLYWQICNDCGLEHTRRVCPACRTVVPVPVQVISGEIETTELFSTGGLILAASLDNQRLRFVYHEDGEFKREDGSTILSGDLRPDLHFEVAGHRTVVVHQNRLLIPGAIDTPQPLDDSPLFAPVQTVGTQCYWLSNGELLRLGTAGCERIGSVLQNQTIFWVGSSFGLGLSRSAGLQTGFVFTPAASSLNDSVKFDRINGQLTHAICALGDDRAWVLLNSVERGRLTCRLIVVHRSGKLLGSCSDTDPQYDWLNELGTLCAAGDILLAGTDRGVVRLELHGSTVLKTREFRATAAWVNSTTRLLAGNGMLIAIGSRQIVSLRLN